jgi:hypothetical protein
MSNFKKQIEKDRKQNISKGTIDIRSCYTICHMCGKLLIRTYAETNDPHLPVECYIICGTCVKVLPEIVQEKLKHPAMPKLYS